MQTATREVIPTLRLLEPKPWQREALNDRHRFKCIAAGRRSGKTVFALIKLITKAAVKPGAICWYVALTYQSAKDIAWRALKNEMRDFWKWNLIKSKNEGELLIELANQSIIQLKGADAPDHLRGLGLDLLVLDEFGLMKPEVWSEVLEPSLSDKHGEGIFIGTPKGYNKFYDLYTMELREPEYWRSWQLKTADCGIVTKKEIERAKRSMDERTFRQEYEASFEVFGGQVFSDFDRKKHVKEFSFQEKWEYDMGMDFGWAAPTAGLFIQVDPEENVYILDEIKAVETPISEVGEAIREKKYYSKWFDPYKGRGCGYTWTAYHGPHFSPNYIYCDPAGDAKSEATGTSSVQELRKLGFDVKYKKSYPGSIQDEIEQIRKWLRNGKLIIHPRCVNLIKALEMFRYSEPKKGIISEIPLKDGISDHWIDALRYFFRNRFPVKKSIVEVY